MAIIAFWNELEKESAQTTSAIAIAVQMAVEHNYRILLVDATFNDKTIENAFGRQHENKAVKELAGGKIDISSGAEGLLSAVASNKATPEIISNYTKVILKNRLDVLFGLKTKIQEEHERSMMLYKDLLITANKYYDMIFIDLSKGLRKPSTKVLLEKSDLVLYTMPPNLININNYKELRMKNPIVSNRKVQPLLGRSDETSGYNVKTTTRFIKEKRIIPTIPYNVRFMEATNEARAAEFFLKFKLSDGAVSGINGYFLQEVERSCRLIVEKLRELNL